MFEMLQTEYIWYSALILCNAVFENHARPATTIIMVPLFLTLCSCSANVTSAFDILCSGKVSWYRFWRRRTNSPDSEGDKDVRSRQSSTIVAARFHHKIMIKLLATRFDGARRCPLLLQLAFADFKIPPNRNNSSQDIPASQHSHPKYHQVFHDRQYLSLSDLILDLLASMRRTGLCRPTVCLA
jgi:hypothetical protein